MVNVWCYWPASAIRKKGEKNEERKEEEGRKKKEKEENQRNFRSVQFRQESLVVKQILALRELSAKERSIAQR